MFVCAILSVLSSTRIHPNSSSTSNNNKMNAKQKKTGIAAIVYCFQYKVSDFLRSLSLLCWAHRKKTSIFIVWKHCAAKSPNIHQWMKWRERDIAHTKIVFAFMKRFFCSAFVCVHIATLHVLLSVVRRFRSMARKNSLSTKTETEAQKNTANGYEYEILKWINEKKMFVNRETRNVSTQTIRCRGSSCVDLIDLRGGKKKHEKLKAAIGQLP